MDFSDDDVSVRQLTVTVQLELFTGSLVLCRLDQSLMDHSNMDHSNMDHHDDMDHGTMNHTQMNHSGHDGGMHHAMMVRLCMLPSFFIAITSFCLV